MDSITVDLTENQLARLKEMASRMSVTIEEMARACLTDILAQTEEGISSTVDHVLEKNAELYRRLT
jgi:flagellar biosynthesis/type III secretory pathway protein FliH